MLAVVEGIDVEPVSAWLEQYVVGATGPFTFERIGGGRSNLTFAVRGSTGQPFVLRRPPLHHVLATAHDMTREFRAISAMGPTAVPVPAAFGLCTDESVNGAPFYVMSLVEGAVVDSIAGAESISLSARARMATDLADVLGELHGLDVDAVGLGDFARREGYIERQIARWSKQWDGSKTAPAACRRRGRQAARRPRPCTAGRRPWCTATTGSATASPTRRRGRSGPCSTGSCARSATRSPTSATSAPTGRRVTEAAAATTIRPAPAVSVRTTTSSSATPSTAPATSSAIDYYVAFQLWRTAIILEGVYARYLGGAYGGQQLGAELDILRDSPVELIELAQAALARLP